MKRLIRPAIAAALLLTGYFSAAPLASAFGDTQCGSWNQQIVFMGIPMPGAATRQCTTTTICTVSADWDGVSWKTNQPVCN